MAHAAAVSVARLASGAESLLGLPLCRRRLCFRLLGNRPSLGHLILVLFIAEIRPPALYALGSGLARRGNVMSQRRKGSALRGYGWRIFQRHNAALFVNALAFAFQRLA